MREHLTLAGDLRDRSKRLYGNWSDVSASLQAAQGTLFAVLHADATGEGQFVDVSAQESLSMSQETAMQTWDLQKRNRRRTGQLGMLPVQLPATGIYQAQDGGWVSILVLAPGGAEFTEFVNWMREKGMQGDLDEEPYASICSSLNMAYITKVIGNPEIAAESMPHFMHINELIQAFVASMPANEVYETGQGRRLLVGLVPTPKNLAENTQLRAREWYREMELEFLHTRIEFPGPPYNLSETPAVITRPPRLGEHTAEVLASLG